MRPPSSSFNSPGVIENHLRAGSLKVEGQFRQVLKSPADFVLAAGTTVEQQKPASAGAGYFATQGAGLPRPLVNLIDIPIGYLTGQLLLQLPRFVEEQAEVIK